MIVISGQVRYDTTVRSTGLPLRQLGDQEFDIVRVAAAMTKYAVMVDRPGRRSAITWKGPCTWPRPGVPARAGSTCRTTCRAPWSTEMRLRGYDPDEDQHEIRRRQCTAEAAEAVIEQTRRGRAARAAGRAGGAVVRGPGRVPQADRTAEHSGGHGIQRPRCH